MQLIFCPHCKLQIESGVTHLCEAKPGGYKGEGPFEVTITLNRKQRRQALARSKIRLRKEKH